MKRTRAQGAFTVQIFVCYAVAEVDVPQSFLPQTLTTLPDQQLITVKLLRLGFSAQMLNGLLDLLIGMIK